MAMDFVPKRRMLAAQMVTAAEQLLSITANMNVLKNNLKMSGGGFQDEDFTSGLMVSGVNLSHLQAYEPNVWLNICVPGLIEWLDGPVEEGNTTTNRDILNAITSKVV